jgi:hypothetical protein
MMLCIDLMEFKTEHDHVLKDSYLQAGEVYEKLGVCKLPVMIIVRRNIYK